MAMAVLLLNGPHPQDGQESNGSGPQEEREHCYVSLCLLYCEEISLSIGFTCHNARFLTLLGMSSVRGGTMSDP